MKRKIDKLIQLDNLKQTYIHRYERVAFNKYKHNYIYIYNSVEMTTESHNPLHSMSVKVKTTKVNCNTCS